MKKIDKDKDSPEGQPKPFNNFVELARKLIAVPSKELQERKEAEKEKSKNSRQWSRKAMF